MKIIYFFAIVFLFSLAFASAVEVDYPIAELGNCGSQTECETYCDNVDNMEVCISVAEKYGLMSASEIAEAKKVLPFLKAGTTPGGCKTKNECDSFCKKDENLMTCVEFGLKMGEISQEEYEMIKKTGGKGPGGCKSKQECDAFCKDSGNLNTCIDFAVANGLMDAKEAETVRKTGMGPGPGGCQGKQECDAFCNKKENSLTCMKFGKEKGLIDSEEADLAIEAGGTDKETFDRFCKQSEANWRRCSDFWVKKGYMTQQQYDESLKEMSNSVGGCSGMDQECKSNFCSKPENTAVCMQAELQMGRISQEQYNEMMQKVEEANKPKVEGPKDEMTPGTEEVPRTETETPGEGTGEPGTIEVPRTEAPTGDMGSGGTTPGAETGSTTPGSAPGGESAGSAPAAEAPAPVAETPSTGAVIFPTTGSVIKRNLYCEILGC